LEEKDVQYLLHNYTL